MSYTEGELVTLSMHRIDCPIMWCVGRVFDHGADGTDPDMWLHESQDEDIAGIATGGLVAIGSGAPRYSVAGDLPDSAEYDAAGLRTLALHFRAAAKMLDERALTLEVLR
jgi:hypothetical protein